MGQENEMKNELNKSSERSLEKWEDFLETWEINKAQESTKTEIGQLLNCPSKHDNHHILKSLLDENIVWQDKAKEAIVDLIVAKILSFRFRKWPLWCLMFAWPTWVWKTQMVKALALSLLWSENAFTKISCETLTESHDLKKLLWAPPSYVWYDDPSPLDYENIVSHYDSAKKLWKINSIIRHLNDFSIILFDEIEKAHPKVRQWLLSLMDEARVEFANWDVARFNNCLIVFTSNIWESEISHNRSKENIGFNPNTDTAKNSSELREKEIKDTFSPEFLWRINDIVEFEKISKDNALQIISIHIQTLNKEIKEYYNNHDISIVLTENCYNYIIENWLSEEKWARDLIRFIDKKIEHRLNILLCSKEINTFLQNEKNIIINIDLNQWEIQFYIDCSNNTEESSKEINSFASIEENKEEENKLWTRPLRKINDIFRDISMYIEYYYLSMDGNIDFSKELIDLEKKLRFQWFVDEDFEELTNRAYIEAIDNLHFIDLFDWIHILDQEKKDIFHPYSQRIILKIVEKKVEENIDKINTHYLWRSILNTMVPIIKQLLKKDVLSEKQIKELMIYIKKVMYDKYKS